MIKAVIFDMDGVLIDSVQVGLRIRKKLLRRYHVDLDSIPDPQGENHRASSLKSLLANIKAHTGIQIDHDEFAQQSLELMRQEFSEDSAPADPELIRFLEELKDHGVICAITSSGLRPGVDIKLSALGIRRYFSVIVTGSDVKEHKPDPKPYLYTIKQLALSPNECLIIEDSLTGVQSGLAAGCRVIGFSQYNPPHKSLPGAMLNVKNWKDLNYRTLDTQR
jgi:beta-phosphoglucomutase